VALPMTSGPGAVSVTLPPDPATVPSGNWMLYLIDDRGIPSPARFVDVP